MSTFADHVKNQLYSHPTSIQHRAEAKQVREISPIGLLRQRQWREQNDHAMKAQAASQALHMQHEKKRGSQVGYLSGGGLTDQEYADQKREMADLSKRFDKERADMRARHRVELDHATKQHSTAD